MKIGEILIHYVLFDQFRKVQIKESKYNKEKLWYGKRIPDKNG